MRNSRHVTVATWPWGFIRSRLGGSPFHSRTFLAFSTQSSILYPIWHSPLSPVNILIANLGWRVKTQTATIQSSVLIINGHLLVQYARPFHPMLHTLLTRPPLTSSPPPTPCAHLPQLIKNPGKKKRKKKIQSHNLRADIISHRHYQAPTLF